MRPVVEYLTFLLADQGSGGRYVGQAQAMPHPYPSKYTMSPRPVRESVIAVFGDLAIQRTGGVYPNLSGP